MIKKQRRIIRSQTKRRVAKEIANKCLLKRKIPKRVSLVLMEFPNIGRDIDTLGTRGSLAARLARRLVGRPATSGKATRETSGRVP